ncbi:MAG TPA: dienelactone hydrolase family protein [Myxococcaceae bacterium]|nr:dienelactone hydrolase family protein [Myxococcaceae bacterium]
MDGVVTSTIGELEVHVVQPDAGARPPLLVVFCHGYGASGEDLVPFVPELLEREPRLAPVRFAFPAGPLGLGSAPWGDARAWWPLDWAKLATLSGDSAGRDRIRNEVPEGLASARRKLQASVEALLAGSGLGPDRVVLGGFSQGGMLATDLALHWEHRAAALVALSAVPLTVTTWRKLAPRRAGLPVIVSHGRQDPVLPYPEGEALRDLLTDAGLAVEFIPFDGPHTVHPEALDRVARLLGSLLPP